jgi:hypothetical protein
VLIRVNLLHFRGMYFNAITELHRRHEHHAIEAKLNMLAQSKNIACGRIVGGGKQGSCAHGAPWRQHTRR